MPSTSNLKWADAPGNVFIKVQAAGLDGDSVANVSLIVSIDKQQLTERVGRLSARQLEVIRAGIDVVLGR